MTEPVCIGPECDRRPKAQRVCGGHYQQLKRGHALTPLRIHTTSTLRDDSGRKRCSKCGEWKTVEHFYPTVGKGNTDGLTSYCSRCDRNARLVRSYGITVEQFDALLGEQGGGCAICQRPPRTVNLHVDHDHACCPTRKKSCGKCVRGLLCEDCNRAIGMLNDDPDILMRAVGYLRG